LTGDFDEEKDLNGSFPAGDFSRMNLSKTPIFEGWKTGQWGK
jgi:hypothetical protein